MNCKAKGNRNEYKTMRLLERTGYACTRAVETLAKVRALTAATRLMETRTEAAMKQVRNVRTLKALTA
jgi:uncharacterized protein with ACT and thioredoxin-like domain